MKFLFLVTFLFSSASGATSERALQRNDFNNDPVAACNGFLKRLSSPAMDFCECEADGRNLISECTSSCTYCNSMGHCGFGRFGGDYRFSEGSIEIQGEYRQVFLLESGPAGEGRVRAKWDNAREICEVSAGDDICQSCELVTCADATEALTGTTEVLTQNIKADCTNLDKGQVLDFCGDITVENKESKLVVFDKTFQKEFLDTHNCPDSSAIPILRASLALAVISYLPNLF